MGCSNPLFHSNEWDRELYVQYSNWCRSSQNRIILNRVGRPSSRALDTRDKSLPPPFPPPHHGRSPEPRRRWNLPSTAGNNPCRSCVSAPPARDCFKIGMPSLTNRQTIFHGVIYMYSLDIADARDCPSYRAVNKPEDHAGGPGATSLPWTRVQHLQVAGEQHIVRCSHGPTGIHGAVHLSLPPCPRNECNRGLRIWQSSAFFSRFSWVIFCTYLHFLSKSSTVTLVQVTCWKRIRREMVQR